MSQRNTINRFCQQYPGPFTWQRGPEVVSNTFRVVCTHTNSPVITSHFVDENLTTEIKMQTITHALNMLPVANFGRLKTAGLEDAMIWFFARFPGPFAVGQMECDGRPSRTVECLEANSVVICDCDRGSDADAEMIVTTIAEALNALCPPRRMNMPQQILAMLRPCPKRRDVSPAGALNYCCPFHADGYPVNQN